MASATDRTGKPVARIGCALGLCLLSAVWSCSNGGAAGGDDSVTAQRDNTGGSATETNVSPVRCDTDSDCAEGVSCVHPNGPDESGQCGARAGGRFVPSDAGPDAAMGKRCASDDECDAGEHCSSTADAQDASGACEPDVRPTGGRPLPQG